MIPVVSVREQRLAGFVLGQESEAVAEIPAAGPLAEVSSQRAAIAHLRAGNTFDRLNQAGIRLPGLGVLAELFERDQRARAQTGARAVLDAGPLADSLDVPHPAGRDYMVLHQAEQVGPASQDRGILPEVAEQPKRLLLGGRGRIFKGSHQAIPPFSRAASTLSGVSGKVGTRTPMALATALAMAAAGEFIGGSPSPIGPRLCWSASVTMWTTSSPTAAGPASRWVSGKSEKPTGETHSQIHP